MRCGRARKKIIAEHTVHTSKQARQATAIHQVKKFKFECDQHTTKCTKKIPLFDSKYHHGANCLLILPSDSMFWIFRRCLSFPLLLLLVVLLQFFFFTCQCLHVLACLPFFRVILLPIPSHAGRPLSLSLHLILILGAIVVVLPIFFTSNADCRTKGGIRFGSVEQKHFYFALIFIRLKSS